MRSVGAASREPIDAADDEPGNSGPARYNDNRRNARTPGTPYDSMKTKRTQPRARRVLMAIVAALALTASATAQTATPRSVIASGGVRSSGGGATLDGTIGQSVIRRTSGTRSTVSQSFWYMPASTPSSIATDIRRGAGTFASAPNPFSIYSTVRIRLEKREHVYVALYDGLGRHVRTLFDAEHPEGELALSLDGSTLASGTYMAHLSTGNRHRTLRIVVVK